MGNAISDTFAECGGTGRDLFSLPPSDLDYFERKRLERLCGESDLFDLCYRRATPTNEQISELLAHPDVMLWYRGTRLIRGQAENPADDQRVVPAYTERISGYTALHMAVIRGHVEAARLIIDAALAGGADVDSPDPMELPILEMTLGNTRPGFLWGKQSKTTPGTNILQ